MAHLVLARKYRPKYFSEVVGQDSIVTTLTSAILRNRVAHAMLFTGGRGLGKTTIARIIAKALVCLSRTSAEPCGSCSHCQAIDNFSSLDVIEIDGASHTGVDDIRELRDSARYQPAQAIYKIFIIDEVHMLSTSAFNALLKLLEEPPTHVKFIFATTEVHKIPKTILSRCQRYDFKRMSVDTIHNTLKDVTDKEGFSFEDNALSLIASLADGALRDALSLTEQVLSHGKEHYSLAFVADCFGIVSHAAVKDVCRNIILGQVDSALLIVKNVYDSGLDLCQLMDAISERFRVLSFCAHVEKAKALVICPEALPEDFELIKTYDKADLKRLFAMAIDGTAQVFQAQKPRHALELFVLRASLRPPISDAVTINYYLQKLDAIMHNRPLPQDLVANISEKEAIPLAKSPIRTEAFREFIEHLKETEPSLVGHLRLARSEVDEKACVVVLHFDQSLHYEHIMRNLEHPAIINALNKAFGPSYSLSLKLKQLEAAVRQTIKTEAEIDEESLAREKEALFERARNSPLVKKALEIFGGDITDVKRVN